MLRLLVVPLVAACAILTSPLHSEAGNRIGIHGFFGYQDYSMEYVNAQIIGPINDELLQIGGPTLDEIEGSGSFGGGLLVDVGPSLRLALDYERLGGTSRLTLANETIEVRVPANVALLTATWYFPGSMGLRFGLGAGVGWYHSDAAVEYSSTQPQDSEIIQMDGSGLGWHIVGQSDLALSQQAYVEASIGYRSAEVEDLDWGEFMSRLGLAVYFSP